MKSYSALEQYLNRGIRALALDMMASAADNPKGSAFFARYALQTKKAERKRHSLETLGEHIPSFLIASITQSCNLNCRGCYDHASRVCHPQAEMAAAQWEKIFFQAEDLGVSAILLAGGEPLMRLDVLEVAARYPSILFPVFTNGTLLQQDLLHLFETNRNLIPVISIEGGSESTDHRRGDGVYKKIQETMHILHQARLPFGTSVTVTSNNITEVTKKSFVEGLKNFGCCAAVFVEYVPVQDPQLSLSEEQRRFLAEKISSLRRDHRMLIISFPGDEQEAGGCLAAGRGFFHINAFGGVEPCPFSPFSDTSLKVSSLRGALKSPLFSRLRDGGHLLQDHVGGCVLFHQADLVQSLSKTEI